MNHFLLIKGGVGWRGGEEELFSKLWLQMWICVSLSGKSAPEKG